MNFNPYHNMHGYIYAKYLYIAIIKIFNFIKNSTIIYISVKSLIWILLILLSVAYFTLFERKLLALIQNRVGPKFVGLFGLLQAIADAMKLIFKETIFPFKINKVIYIISPLILFVSVIISWLFIALGNNFIFVNVNLSIIYILFFSSIAVYSIILAGWSSNSRYSFSGALRSSAQMISYEITLALNILTIPLCVSSFNLNNIINFQIEIWFIIPLFPSFVLFFIAILAETNRTPFDLPEAEGELVAGYNVEYSAISFALFFLSEYCSIIFMSILGVCLSFGGDLYIISNHYLVNFFYIYNNLLFILFNELNLFNFNYLILIYFGFILKIFIFMFIFVWVRGVLPRYRYDQLMHIGWKILLPISLMWLIVVFRIIS
jgi:NADH-quinone oxidoreductase subunit H